MKCYDTYDALLYFFAHIAREVKEIGGSVICVMDCLNAEGRHKAESWSGVEAARPLRPHQPSGRIAPLFMVAMC